MALWSAAGALRATVEEDPTRAWWARQVGHRVQARSEMRVEGLGSWTSCQGLGVDARVTVDHTGSFLEAAAGGSIELAEGVQANRLTLAHLRDWDLVVYSPRPCPPGRYRCTPVQRAPLPRRLRAQQRDALRCLPLLVVTGRAR